MQTSVVALAFVGVFLCVFFPYCAGRPNRASLDLKWQPNCRVADFQTQADFQMHLNRVSIYCYIGHIIGQVYWSKHSHLEIINALLVPGSIRVGLSEFGCRSIPDLVGFPLRFPRRI